MFFEDQVSIMSVDECPFSIDVRMAEAMFYSLYLAFIQISAIMKKVLANPAI